MPGADHVGVTALRATAIVVAGALWWIAPHMPGGALAVDRMILAQQLPQAPPPVGKVRRGPDGRLLVVPDEPSNPAEAAAPPSADPRRAAAPKAAPVPPVAVEPAAPLPPLGPAPPLPELPPEPVLAGPVPAMPHIILPEPFAIELPGSKQTTIRPQDSPLAELLASAFAGGEAVTHDLLTSARAGITRVTFTAWQGIPAQSRADARVTVPLLVLRNGQSPIGVSTGERSTGANNTPKLVRDDSGALHLTWREISANGTRVMYQRGYSRGPEGGIRWDGTPVALSEGLPTPATAFVGVASVPGGAMVAWQGDEGIVLRRIVAGAAGWKIEPPILTAIASAAVDAGPSIVARGGDLYLLTPSGVLARSSDNANTWRTDQVPFLDGQMPKSVAMDVDARGTVHIVSAVPLDEKYAELRYIRRDTAGEWVDAHNLLGDLPAWRRAVDADVLADFPTIRVDQAQGIHVAWHGTANSRAAGKNEAYYRYRPASAPDSWSAWQEVQRLWPFDREEYFGAFAPSLALDPATGSAIAVAAFIDKNEHREAGAVLLRGGRMAKDRLRLSPPPTGDSGLPLGVWFPSAAPIVHRAGDSAWLDVLQTVKMPADEKTPNVIVYQSVEVGRWLGGKGGTDNPVGFSAMPGATWLLTGLGFLGLVTLGVLLRQLRWR